MVERCPGCGLQFDREPGWVLGAMTINTAFMFVVGIPTMFAGFVLTYPDIAVAPVAIATVAAAGLAALVGYPFSKTVWVAIDLMMVPEGSETGTERRDASQGSVGPGPTRSSSSST
jgi:hypothetical protein